jgi:CheY-like chemotaxis protein
MWHQWKPRLIPQLLADPEVQPETWSLPRTASVAEQMSAAAQAIWPPRQGLISIHTHAFRDYRAISDACSHAGYSTVWCSPAQSLHASGVEAAVFNGVAADRPTLALLTEIAQQVHPAPVVALLDYVRRQDCDQALAAGAAAVVAKPLLTYDLLWHLSDLIDFPPAKQAPDTQSGFTSAA